MLLTLKLPNNVSRKDLLYEGFSMRITLVESVVFLKYLGYESKIRQSNLKFKKLYYLFQRRRRRRNENVYMEIQ